MSSSARSRLLLLAVVLVLLAPGPALAYIGPGAGLRAGRVVLRRLRRVFSAHRSRCVTWPVRLLSRTLFGLAGAARRAA